MQITKKELEKLYRENPNKVVCEKLGITNPTLISYLKRHNIKTKGRGWHLREGNRLKIQVTE